MPPGKTNLQWFTIATIEYAQFLSEGTLDTTVDQISTTINGVWWEWGITRWLDFTLYGQLAYVDAAENGDTMFFTPTLIQLGFQLIHEDYKSFAPTTRIILYNAFPTTPYDSLEEGKSYQAGGNGSIQTGVSLVVAKTLFIDTMHPLLANLNLDYNYQFKSTLRGPNTFGGDISTKVKTNPGNIYIVNLGLELSLTQKWVIQTDINYQYSGNTTFNGILGTTTPIEEPGVSQTITLTPGLEYNFSEKFGLFSSLWITPWGKNTSALFGFVFSLESVF